MTIELNIKGMSCGHCVKHVTNALEEVEGVREVQVSLDKANAVVEATDIVKKEQLVEAITEAGYEVIL